MAKKKKLKTVLSIDGGGIRGVIPALVLTELERLADKPVCRMFDLIAGTSTGGILAAGLTAPDKKREKPRYSAKKLAELYTKKGSSIFSRSVWHRMRSIGGTTQEKYPSHPIESILDEYFNDLSLTDAMTELLITAYDIERRTPFFFRSRRARTDASYDWRLADAARATSAAPTYFEPYLLKNDNSEDYYPLVDGGVFANNPTMVAYTDARQIWGADVDLLIVSLGTGELTRPYMYKEVVDWGLIEWAQPILSVVFDGVADVTHGSVEQLVSALGGQSAYHRFQTKLTIGNDDMDDASNSNLRLLHLLSESMIRKHKKPLKKIADLLKSHNAQANT